MCAFEKDDTEISIDLIVGNWEKNMCLLTFHFSQASIGIPKTVENMVFQLFCDQRFSMNYNSGKGVIPDNSWNAELQ